METSGTVQVTTLNDEIDEAAETFTVTLAGPDLPAGVTLGTDRATGTITDDDSLFVTVTAGSATVAEGSSAVFEVALSGGTSTADVVLEYGVGGTATAGDDYAKPEGTLTIAGGASGASLAIETLADDVLDPGETLEVILTGATTANGAVNVSSTPATTTITDAGAVTVAVAPATVTEGDDASFAVELSGKVAAPVRLSWSAASGPGDTAEAGTDYTAIGGTLTFVPTGRPARRSRCPRSRTTWMRLDETFTVTLSGSRSAGRGDAGDRSCDGDHHRRRLALRIRDRWLRDGCRREFGCLPGGAVRRHECGGRGVGVFRRRNGHRRR